MAKPDKKKKFDAAKYNEAVGFAEKLLKRETAGGEKFMLALHVVKDDGRGGKKLVHHHSYFDFPVDDWGKCLIATGVEAKRAALMAATGAMTT